MSINNQQAKNIILQFPDLCEKYQRLKGVGGFISILGSDPRISLFCRYNHVQRVVRLTEVLVNKLEIGQCQSIIFLAHFHDINRLPLTYVTEKALSYQQNLNIRPYLRECTDIIPERFISALEAIMEKKIDYSFDVRFVYLSDMIVNFIEDLLFMAVLLNVSPDYIPSNVLAATGFDSNKSEFGDDLEFLKSYFKNDRKSFSEYFSEVSLKYMLRFIEKLGGVQMFLSNTSLDKSMAVLVVKQFLTKTVFPIVDEEIVKETSLVQKVVLPYYNNLKNTHTNLYQELWDMTDQQFLHSAAEMGLIKYESIREFWPTLQYSRITHSSELQYNVN